MPKVNRKIRKENKKNKKAIIRLTIIISFILLIGIVVLYILFNSKGNQRVKKDVDTTATPKSKVVKKIQIVNEDSNTRPIAIMIDNNIGNNLHAGLQEAYLSYEIIVEGGLTRIMAIFKDKNTSLIGPVRSARHYFLDYALESDCIYTHYGWSPYAEKDIKTLNINNINGLYDNDPFWRDQTISAPHNVFTSIEKNYNYAEKKNYNKETTKWKLLNYKVDPINLNVPIQTETVVNKETGKKEKIPIYQDGLLVANNVVLSYSYYQTRGYTYDSERQIYLRFMNHIAHKDKTTENQLTYKNLIIMKVANHSLDSYGRQDLDTVGTGTGYYITNGYALPINWTKPARNAKTKYTYSDGKEIEVNDGNTMIQIVPTTSTITIE